METWECRRCRSANLDGARSCVRCGSMPDLDQPVSVRSAFSGVGVLRDMRADGLSAALTGPMGMTGEPVLQPFFQLDEAPHRPHLRRVTRIWPLVVFLVVLLFFAVAGLSR